MKEPYRKGESDSILTSSLAPVAVRRQAKRRQRHWWAGRLSSEKQRTGCRPFTVSGKATPAHGVRSRARAGSGVVEDPRHAKKQHAREPGDLECARAIRPVREGE